MITATRGGSLIINWIYQIPLSYIRRIKHMATCPALYFLRVVDDCFHRNAEVVVRIFEWYRTVPEGSNQQPCRHTSQGRVMLGDDKWSHPILSVTDFIGLLAIDRGRPELLSLWLNSNNSIYEHRILPTSAFPVKAWLDS